MTVYGSRVAVKKDKGVYWLLKKTLICSSSEAWATTEDEKYNQTL